MPVTNLLKPQVDQPVFEWMRFAPTATSSTATLLASDASARYMYYIVGQTMWRYDTYSDSWQECAAPNIAPATVVAGKYASYVGSRGHTISATSTTITIGGLGRLGNVCVGSKIRILYGTGAGQERTITACSDGVIHDNGLATTASATQIGDSTKKWRVNQWDGYNCRLTFSTGQSQVRRILYNDTTTLTFSDANHQAVDSFNNTGFSAVTPFAVPVTTAGAQTNFVIESSVLTVDSSWAVTPDESSIYQIMTGGIWLMTAAAATPFAAFQYYDILLDSWFTKTPSGPMHHAAALGTDFAIDRTGEAGGVFISGVTASSAAAKTLVQSGATYAYDRYANYQLRIVSGKGIGQRRRIAANTADTFYVEKKWDITPDNTSGYAIYGDTDKMWLAGNASSALYQYSVEHDLWSSAPIVDTGVARQISATPAAGNTGLYGPPHEGYAITSITYNATGVLTTSVNSAGGTYAVGDLVTLTTTGSNAQAYVTGITGNGAVTGLQLAFSGTNYGAGTTSAVSGGSGSGLILNITTGKVGNVVTAVNHDFRNGEFVTIAGCTAETTFNNTFAVIGTNSQTAFSIAANSAATQSPTAGATLTTSLIVDASQNWNTNEHVGRVVFVQTPGTSPTNAGARRITANTATTLTLSSVISVMANGQSRYVIQEARPFGAMCIDKVAERSPNGWTTSGTATTLVDTTKNWRINQYQNCRVRIVSGTGEGNDVVITSNTATTLTVASWNVATPDATSKYEIMDSYGIVTTGAGTTTVTDANKNFPTNYLAGKRIRYIAGTASSSAGTATVEVSVTSNTGTVITIPALTSNATDTFYAIYEIPARSTGINITWLYGVSDVDKKGRWLISPRGGGSNIFDIFDIPTSTWEITPFVTPITATLTTGSMYAYNGVDSYYFTKDATNRIYELDLSKFQVEAATSIPYAHSTATLSNKFEIVKTVDGLTYLYVMRHTGQEMWRTLKFW
jgi:hypothetical protein